MNIYQSTHSVIFKACLHPVATYFNLILLPPPHLLLLPQGESNRSSTCLPCYYSCLSCSGPNDYECSACPGDAQLELGPAGRSMCHNNGLVSKVGNNFSI